MQLSSIQKLQIQKSLSTIRDDHGQLGDEKVKAVTSTQQKYVEKYMVSNSMFEVASFFNVSYSTVENQIREARRRSPDIARMLLARNPQKKLSSKSETKKPRTNNGNVPSAKELLALAESQDFKCNLTGLDIQDASKASLDHKEPLANGGSNSIDNVQWVLKEINAMKGTLSQKRFVLLCCQVADHHRKQLRD